jgi:ankyrin repeat protein
MQPQGNPLAQLQQVATALKLGEVDCPASRGLRHLLDACDKATAPGSAAAVHADAGPRVVLGTADLRLSAARDSRSELWDAVVSGDEDGVDRLLGAAKKSETGADANGWTLLHAVALGATSAAPRIASRVLSDASLAAQVNLPSTDGITPLMLALALGTPCSLEVACVLLASGRVDVSAATEDGVTALHLAVEADTTPCIRHLLGLGAGTTCRAKLSGNLSGLPGVIGHVGVTPGELAVLRGREAAVIDALVRTLHSSGCPPPSTPTLPPSRIRALAAALVDEVELSAQSRACAADVEHLRGLLDDIVGTPVGPADTEAVLLEAEKLSPVIVAGVTPTGKGCADRPALCLSLAGPQQAPITVDGIAVHASAAGTAAALLAAFHGCAGCFRFPTEAAELLQRCSIAMRLPAASVADVNANVWRAGLPAAVAQPRPPNAPGSTMVAVAVPDGAGCLLGLLVPAAGSVEVFREHVGAAVVEDLIQHAVAYAGATGVAPIVNVDEALEAALLSRFGILHHAICTALSGKPVTDRLDLAALRQDYAAIVATAEPASLCLTDSPLPVSVRAAAAGSSHLTDHYATLVGPGAFSPRHMVAACGAGRAALLSQLISADSQLVHECDPSTGRTPLIAAVEGRHSSVVGVLLSHHASPEHVGPTGIPPLVTACGNGDEVSALALMDRGANVEASAPGGVTPLLAALLGPNPRIAPQVLRCGADVHRADAFGLTPVMAAKLHADVQAVRQTMQAGATIAGISSAAAPGQAIALDDTSSPESSQLVIARDESRHEIHTVATLVHNVESAVAPLRLVVEERHESAVAERAARVDTGLDVHTAAVVHPSAAEAVAPESVSGAAVDAAASQWHIASVLDFADVLKRLVRQALLSPPVPCVDDERLFLVRSWTKSLQALLAHVSHCPIAPTLDAVAKSAVVSRMRLCVDWGIAAVASMYVVSSAVTARRFSDSVSAGPAQSIQVFREAAALALPAPVFRLWEKAGSFAGYPCGLVVPRRDLIDAMIHAALVPELRPEHVAWRRGLLADLFDPNDTGFTTLPHFVTVSRILSDEAEPAGISATALDALFALAGVGALRVFAGHSECCSHLRGRPAGTYCVSVGASASAECGLCIVEPREVRRATKDAREPEATVTTYASLPALREALLHNALARQVAGKTYRP